MKIERLSKSEWERLKRIRLAALEEAPEAFATTLEVARGWGDDVWRQQAESLPTFVARIDSVEVGMARGMADGSCSDAFLISMWVSPAERGKRIGEQLVEAVMQWARDAGFSRLLLDVADDNSAAVTLYERLDFQPTGDTSVYPQPRSFIKEHRRTRNL